MAMQLKVKTAYDSSDYIINPAPAYVLVDVPGDAASPMPNANCLTA